MTQRRRHKGMPKKGRRPGVKQQHLNKQKKKHAVLSHKFRKRARERPDLDLILDHGAIK